MNRGAVYVFMKQDDAAEKDFRKAVELDPHSLPAYANLAGYYLYKKDPEEGRRSVSRRDGEQSRFAGAVPASRRLAAAGRPQGRRRSGRPAAAHQAAVFGGSGFRYRRLLSCRPEHRCRAEGVSARPVTTIPRTRRCRSASWRPCISSGRTEDAQKMVDHLLKDRSGRHHGAHDQRPSAGHQGQPARRHHHAARRREGRAGKSAGPLHPRTGPSPDRRHGRRQERIAGSQPHSAQQSHDAAGAG